MFGGIPDITLNHHRFRSPPHFPSAAAPMTIPRAQEQPVPPPPLPPPTYIPISPDHDPGWQWGNDPNGSDFGKPASVKPGSSLLGGAPGRAFGGRVDKDSDATHNHSIDWARRGSAISTATTATITGNNNDMADSGSLTPSDDGSIISRPGSNYRYVPSISCALLFWCHPGTMDQLCFTVYLASIAWRCMCHRNHVPADYRCCTIESMTVPATNFIGTCQQQRETRHTLRSNRAAAAL